MRNYFLKLEKRSVPRFILEMTGLIFLAKAAIALLFTLLDFETLRPGIIYLDLGDISSESASLLKAFFFFFNFCIQPLLETLIAQGLVIGIVSLFTSSRTIKIIISAVFFTLWHGFPAGLVALPGGVLFAWAFVIQQKKSFWQAIGIVYLIHIFHNIIASLIQFSASLLPSIEMAML